MRQFLVLSISFSMLVCPANAFSQSFTFQSNSTLTQEISSSILGDFSLSTLGSQTFSVDLDAGTISATSLLFGTDLPDPSGTGFVDYEITDPMASGTINLAPGEIDYDIGYSTILEMRITSGSFSGVVLETANPVELFAMNVSPFETNTTLFGFGLAEWVVQSDPSFQLPVGTLIGESFDQRLIIEPIPEPTGAAIVCICCAMLMGRRNRRPISG